MRVDPSNLYVAKYYRYHKELSSSFTSLDDAVKFLRDGEDDGALSCDSITYPSGTVLNKADLYPLIWGKEKPSDEGIDLLDGFYKKLVWWTQHDQRTIYGVRDGEVSGQEVFVRLATHDASAVISNCTDVDFEKELRKKIAKNLENALAPFKTKEEKHVRDLAIIVARGM